MDAIVVVTGIFGVTIIAGIVLIAVLWSAYGDLRDENERLQGEIGTLLELLERYLRSEKQITQNPSREEKLDEILMELRHLRAANSNGISIGAGASVGQVSAGRGIDQAQ